MYIYIIITYIYIVLYIVIVMYWRIYRIQLSSPNAVLHHESSLLSEVNMWESPPIDRLFPCPCLRRAFQHPAQIGALELKHALPSKMKCL